jgi:hypothetical protein
MFVHDSGDTWFRRRSAAFSLLRLLTDGVDRINVVVTSSRSSGNATSGRSAETVLSGAKGCQPMPLNDAVTRLKLMTALGRRHSPQMQLTNRALPSIR